jgi:cysteinyl-tRNA synthetase
MKFPTKAIHQLFFMVNMLIATLSFSSHNNNNNNNNYCFVQSFTPNSYTSRTFSTSRISTSAASRSKYTSTRLSMSNDDNVATAQKPKLTLYNSLTRGKEPFNTIEPNKVSMYTCGPTVYDYAHVGNFRAFLTYDVLKRTLSYFGYDVDHICNLTDVDDKIIKKCNVESKSLLEITRKFEDLFMDDLHALNIIPARKYPRATEHIGEMVTLIQELADVGLAYQSEEGSWYFNVAKKEGYGQQLVNLDVSNMKSNASGVAGAQRASADSDSDDDLDADEYDADKVGVRDFALWKAYKPQFDREDAIWETDIGKGRPGWHLECSAMARKYLGDTIDIHCGGIDLKFPHHENEIAQSEGATGKKFCSCWLHNGFVNIGDEKMSKSKGNFLTLRTACPKSVDVRAYRYLIVSSQYRNPLSFTEQAMKGAKGALSRLDDIIVLLNDTLGEKATSETDANEEESKIKSFVSSELEKFDIALADDINMPRASASLFAVIKAAEAEFKRLKKEKNDIKKGRDVTHIPLDLDGLEAARDALLQMDKVFGLLYTVPQAKNEDGSLIEEESKDDEIPDDVVELVKSRSAAKDAKDWDLADSLRSRITELGFAVKDVKGGEPIISRL